MSSKTAEDLSFLRCHYCKSLTPVSNENCQACGGDLSITSAESTQQQPDRLKQLNTRRPPRGTERKEEATNKQSTELTDKPSGTQIPPSTSMRRPKISTRKGVRSTSHERQTRDTPSTSSYTSDARVSKETAELAGWLVDWDAADGRGIELRAGSFFLSSRRLRPRDIVFPQSGLNSPHALLRVTRKRSREFSVVLQDMLSDSSICVVRGQEELQLKDSDSVKLCHGDVITLGDRSFHIALIPS